MVIFSSSGWAEMLCGMLWEARGNSLKNVIYSRKEAGLNYSGRQGVSVNQTSACVETLNLPGGQQQGRVLGDRGSRNSEFVSRLSLKPQSTMETEGLGGGGGGPGNIWGQAWGSVNMQTLCVHSWKWMAGRHQEGLSHLIWGGGGQWSPCLHLLWSGIVLLPR